MPKILKVNTPSDYSRYLGHTDRHPLVSVIEYSRISPIRHSLNSYGVYGIFLQDNNNLDLVYGCGKYDYKDGSLICVAPGQIGGKEDNGEFVSIGGWAMLFQKNGMTDRHPVKARSLKFRYRRNFKDRALIYILNKCHAFATVCILFFSSFPYASQSAIGIRATPESIAALATAGATQ